MGLQGVIGRSPDTARSGVSLSDPARLERATALARLGAGRTVTRWMRLGRVPKKASARATLYAPDGDLLPGY